MRTITALLLASVSFPVLAQSDTHIRQVAYSPTKRIEIVGVVGQPTTITFPRGESVYRVVQSESPDETGEVQASWRGPRAEDVKDSPIGGNLPLWPVRPGVSMMTVVTVAGDGTQKVYPFRLLARQAEAGAADADGVVLNLIFTGMDPVRQAAATQAFVARKQVVNDQVAKDRIRSDAFNAAAGDCHYEAKGKKPTTIEPRCPLDDGQWTLLRFPGLSRKPAIYVVGSDGAERLARQHGDGEFVVVEEIAARFRLRLGQEVLDIINNGFDPVGRPAGSGTLSPAVHRDVIQATSK